MLEFDWTLWFLMGLFLANWFVLTKWLFNPYVALRKKRKDSTTGFLEAAKQMAAEREAIMAGIKSDIAGAAAKAREEFEAGRGEGLGRQRQMLEEAAARAASELDAARKELQAVADEARKKLRADVERFSDEICSKLAGV